MDQFSSPTDSLPADEPTLSSRQPPPLRLPSKTRLKITVLKWNVSTFGMLCHILMSAKPCGYHRFKDNIFHKYSAIKITCFQVTNSGEAKLMVLHSECFLQNTNINARLICGVVLFC